MLHFNSAFMDKLTVYSPYNIEYNKNRGSHHVHCYLVRGNSKHEHNMTLTKFVDTYGFKLYSEYLSSFGLTEAPQDNLNNMVWQMRNIFMRYRSNSIAGIREIDNMTVSETSPPESKSNPFHSVYMRTVTIEVFYDINFVYPLLYDWEINHYGSRYSAGSFVDEIEDPLTPL